MFGINDSPNGITNTGPAGTRYHFEAWVRSAAHTGRAKLRVREYLNGVQQGPTQLTPPGSRSRRTWQKITFDYTALAAGSTIDFNIMNDPIVPGEIFQVDDVVIQASPVIAAGGDRASLGVRRREQPDQLRRERQRRRRRTDRRRSRPTSRACRPAHNATLHPKRLAHAGNLRLDADVRRGRPTAYNRYVHRRQLRCRPRRGFDRRQERRSRAVGYRSAPSWR